MDLIVASHFFVFVLSKRGVEGEASPDVITSEMSIVSVSDMTVLRHFDHKLLNGI
jgi:hypothetical protein